MTFYGMANRALLGAMLLSGYVQAAESVPSTAAILQQMERVEAHEESGPLQVDAGEAMFRASCSQCHETSRATSKIKSYDGWLATVHRMAAKEGASIPASQIEPIASYLASMNPVETNADPAADIPTIGEVLAASSVSLNATVSLLWRKGDALSENEGFSPDVWVGADWNPPDNPFSIQIMACTSCHDDPNGMKLELVEGSLRADLIHLLSGQGAADRNSDVRAELKGGRFIVPFGAYSGMAHPGVYRTLTNPLMYNMGRRLVGPYYRGGYEPVLPMPYSDEGIDLHIGIPLPADLVVQLDGYAVNGLQESLLSFSRSYTDNNDNAALGGRASIGNAWVRIGGSYSAGELQVTGAPQKDYRLVGGDAVLRYRDYLRFYFEYAKRIEDTNPTLESRFSGNVVEVEGMVWRQPRVTLLARYDNIRHPVPVYMGATIERFTWGPSVTLPGGSQVIVNHENWKHDSPLANEDVYGVRWIATF